MNYKLMKRNAKSKTKNVSKLFEYAEKLRIKAKIMAYMEVFL